MGNTNPQNAKVQYPINNQQLRKLIQNRTKVVQLQQTHFLDFQTTNGFKPTMIIKQDQHKISDSLLQVQPRPQSIILSQDDHNQSIDIVQKEQKKQKNLEQKQNNEFLLDRQQQALIDETTDQYQYPFCCIGYLFVDFGHFQGYGTASLIYKNLIITAAHNLFDRKTGKKARQIFFTPALNGFRGTPFQIQISAQTVFYPNQFQLKGEDSDKFDYAIISLGQDKDLSKEYGFLGIKTNWNDKQDQVFVYGYPYNKNKEKQGKHIYGMYQRMKEVDQFFIKYHIYTYSGMSGSPIFIKVRQDADQVDEKFQYQLVGIHTTKDKNNKVNKGVRFTKCVRKKIREWITKNKQKQAKQLNLLKCSLNSDQLISILRSRNWQQLVQLKLGNNLLDHRAVQFLISHSAFCPNLIQLSLFSNNIQFKGFNAIFNYDSKNTQKKPFPRLKRLNLQGNKIVFKPGTVFFTNQSQASTIFPQLQILLLSYNIFGNRGICQLCKSPNLFPMLLQLNLSGVQMNADGVKILLRDQKLFPDLRKLWLRFNAIGNQGLRYFQQYPKTFKNLQWLSLTDNLIQDEGIAFLVADNQEKTQPLQKLAKLQLIKNRITFIGFKLLAKVCEDKKFLPNLKHLAIYQNSVGKEDGHKKIKQYLMNKMVNCQKVLIHSHQW